MTETADRRVIEWKFGQLDKSGDGQLNRREFRVLRRLVRKVVRPKRCTKNFPRLCDTDQDRKISRSEWSVCLGVGINSKSDLVYSKNKVSYVILCVISTQLQVIFKSKEGQYWMYVKRQSQHVSETRLITFYIDSCCYLFTLNEHNKGCAQDLPVDNV